MRIGDDTMQVNEELTSELKTFPVAKGADLVGFGQVNREMVLPR